jgi:hypothetical protein
VGHISQRKVIFLLVVNLLKMTVLHFQNLQASILQKFLIIRMQELYGYKFFKLKGNSTNTYLQQYLQVYFQDRWSYVEDSHHYSRK